MIIADYNAGKTVRICIDCVGYMDIGRIITPGVGSGDGVFQRIAWLDRRAI
jgi:hypothetical protein